MRGYRSAGGQALTGHNKLDRSISGPLSMTGTGGSSGSKQAAPEDLAGAAIEPEDEEGLSTGEVCTSQSDGHEWPNDFRVDRLPDWLVD